MSQTNIQFSVASHIMTALAYFHGQPLTSAQLAFSVKSDPSFVRRALARLARAGLVNTTRGKNGACELARAPARITLLDIYRASEAPPAFAIHQYAVEPQCPISTHIKQSMGAVLGDSQQAFERNLAGVTLADLAGDIKKKHRAR